MGDFVYDYEYEEPYVSDSIPQFRESFETITENCVEPSVASVGYFITFLVAYNLVFNILTQSDIFPKAFFHLVSFSLGTILLLVVHSPIKLLILLFFLLMSYAILKVSHKICQPVNIAAIVYISLMVFCEFSLPYTNLWLQVRGEIMIMVMKVYSLTHDMQETGRYPKFSEYAGYIFCPANCLLGPWISFGDYCSVVNRPHKKNVWWLLRIWTCLLCALFCLLLSNCWCSFFLRSDNLWVAAYRQALTFRTSHYFVSYLSEMSMVVAGYKSAPSKWCFNVVNPFHIELPSSLVLVVVNWNVPMHLFLKKYVYRKILPRGRFQAILATFFVSSLLHGFNTELSVVLLTLGFFSYVQLKAREKLAEHLDACVAIRPCRHACGHRYKRGGTVVLVLMLLFGGLTVVHLAYLGMLMDSIDNSESDGIYDKWEGLGFFSHLVMFFAYLYSLS